MGLRQICAAASATFESFPEGALAGTVPEESFLILQFDVEAVDLYTREAGCAVGGDAGGRDRFVGHPEPSTSRKQTCGLHQRR
jgi:hypothetical protein